MRGSPIFDLGRGERLACVLFGASTREDGRNGAGEPCIVCTQGTAQTT